MSLELFFLLVSYAHGGNILSRFYGSACCAGTGYVRRAVTSWACWKEPALIKRTTTCQWVGSWPGYYSFELSSLAREIERDRKDMDSIPFLEIRIYIPNSISYNLIYDIMQISFFQSISMCICRCQRHINRKLFIAIAISIANHNKRLS